MVQIRPIVIYFAAALGAGGCVGTIGADGIDDNAVTAGGGSIVRNGSAKCLDPADAGTADGTNLRQYACSGTAAQKFQLVDGGGGQVKIVNTSSGKCVDISGNGTANGTNIQLWTCNGTAAQLYLVEDQGNGFGQLRNLRSNKCVDVAGASNADGANVQLYACNGTAAQQWKINGPSVGSGSDGGVAGGGTPTGFVHPGVLVNKGQLDFVKTQLAAKKAPWTGAFNAANTSWLGSLSYTPHPRADVQCGPISNPDIGCTDEKNDSAAAYTHALLWYCTGNAAHAEKAIQIMNGWASTITQHELSNAPLESAWVASLWPRAGEIIRYTYGGWRAGDVKAFGNMLRNVYLPQVVKGSSSNGNWELSMIEATIGIGVFLDDRATFDTAVAMWKKRVPAYIYVTSDGATPVRPATGNAKTAAALKSFWYNAPAYVNGLAQETCRDLGHVQYGFAAMTNAAETARIQGVDLFSLESGRLAAGYELHAQYINGTKPNSTAICGVNLNAVSADPMWEVGYNALANRLGMALPQTSKLLGKIRPTYADHMMDWETLTHAEIGNAGLR